MIDAGITVAASTDWRPNNPFACMALAVTHQIGSGPLRNDGPAQKIDPAGGLRDVGQEGGRARLVRGR